MLVKRFVKFLKHRWISVLAFSCTLALVINYFIFTPGFFSADSFSQYSQAIGHSELSNWHPITFTLVWKALINLTGNFTSMLALQLILLWSGVFLTSLLVYKVTSSRKKSLIVLLVGFMPFIYAISSTLWKDVHLAHSLYLAATIIVLVFYFVAIENISLRPKNKIMVSTIVGLLLIYATAMRHGPAIAVIPLIIIYVCTVMTTKKSRVIAVFGIVLIVFTSPIVIDKLFHPKNTNLEYLVMLDDIVNISKINEIKASDLSDDNKEYIIQVQRSCYNSKHISGVWLYCERATNKNYRQDMMTYHATAGPEVRSLWIKTIFNHPIRYARYRSVAFAKLLFAEKVAAWHKPQVDKNKFGIKSADNLGLGILNNAYNFTLLNLGFLFRAYFWLLLSIGLLVASFKKRHVLKFYPLILSLTVSGILHTLQYLPTTTAYQYRYTYWTTLSALLACILFYIDIKEIKSARKTSRR